MVRAATCQGPCRILLAQDVSRAGQHYYLIYACDQLAEAAQVLRRWAADPELNFELADAVALMDRTYRSLRACRTCPRSHG